MDLQLQAVTLQGETAFLQERGEQDGSAPRDMAELEQKLSEYVQVPYCVSVESATTGMLLALKALGIGRDDVVMYTSFSFFATADIIALAGAVPMLVDVNPNTYNVDPYCLEYMIGKCIRTHKKLPKALIAVDLFGLPCNYQALEEICGRNEMYLIEDMAHSFGATYQGKRAGGFGRMAVASFFPSAPLAELGEGGAVFCHTEQEACRLKSLRSRVRFMERQRAPHRIAGHLDMVQATVVAEKLERFDFEMECRREVATYYKERLGNAVRFQQVGELCESACTQFVIALKDHAERDGMLRYLEARQIPCHVFEPSPLSHRNRDALGRAGMVNAKAISEKLLVLPMHPYLSRRAMDYICDCVLRGQRELRDEKEAEAFETDGIPANDSQRT